MVAPPQSSRLLDLSPAPAHLEHYARSLGLAEADALPALARALSGQLQAAAGLEPAALIVTPTRLFLRHAADTDADVRLRIQARALDQSCRDLLYIDASRTVELCEHLAAKLQESLGPEIEEARFTAIPRGGVLVLERLASILDLPPERLRPADDPERILVVVDDCAISGARFRQFLEGCENRWVVFAHLCSHPALRAAIQVREPRVLACSSVQDLHDLASFEALPPEHQQRRLKRIENGECYWIGSTEALCFPWNEPDRSVWNPAAGRQERAWKIVPPELCRKNQPPPGVQPLQIQVQPQPEPRLLPALRAQMNRPEIHRLFGFNLESGFPFNFRLSVGSGVADLSFLLTPDPVLSGDATPVYTGLNTHLYRLGSGEVLRFPGVADFRLQDERIDCHVQDSELVELRLLGPVFSYWLERREIPTLHASTVAVEGQAMAFLSRQGGGKTGLAAALMRAGCPLLTDDVMPTEDREGTFFVRSGYPQMRMWPDEAAWFLERWEELPLVHPQVTKRRVPVGEGGFGAFLDSTLPLACLYIPERRAEGPVEIVDVPPRDALIELVRYSFSPHLVAAAGLQPFRFDLFARLVQRVPVRRLRYPAGFERLPEVAAALLHNR